MRLAALVAPKSLPKIQATRSNSAIATRPQFSPPTMRRVAARASSFFMVVMLLYRCCTDIEPESSAACGVVKRLYRSRIVRDMQMLRIGELSKRSGVSPELLRAWERRYKLLEPARSSGGLRLYSLDDLERVRTMRRHITEGVAAAEAAILAT